MPVEYASVSSDPIVLPHVVLYQPEIPPNTGSIIRLCANTGFALHLIKPMGFVLDDKRLRRAGLDYHEYAHISEWSSLQAYCQAHPDRRLIAIETGAIKRTQRFAISLLTPFCLDPKHGV